MDGLLKAAEETIYNGDSQRLRGMLDYIVGICGPDDGPLPPFPEPIPHPELPEFPGFGFPDSEEFASMFCTWLLDQPIEFLIPPNVERKRYEMTSLSTDHACEGELLIIQGRNFGEGVHDGTPSLVCFATNRFTTDRNFCCVEAEEWSDTEIRVRVPECAGSGQLSLRIWEATIEVCGNKFALYMQGDGLDFTGPFITLYLSVDGTRPLYVLPDTDVTLAWIAEPHGYVVVQLEIIELRELWNDPGSWVHGPILKTIAGQPATGSYLFHTPYSEIRLLVKLTAKHTLCSSSATNTLEFYVTVPPVLSIDGVEVTQGIQTYDRSNVADNSLPLVANKDTIVRVYVSCDRGGFKNDEAEVTGDLRVAGSQGYYSYLYPCNGYSPLGGAPEPEPFITARRSDRIKREETDHTLNFKIPASFAVGHQTIIIDVFDSLQVGLGVTHFHEIHWKTVKPLPVKAILMKGRANRLPSTREALFTMMRAFDLLPSPASELRVRKKIYDIGGKLKDWGGYRSDRGLWRLNRLLVGKHTAVEGTNKENIWVGLTHGWNRGQMAWPEFTSCISHRYLKGEAPAGASPRVRSMYEEPYQGPGRIKTAHEIAHCLHLGHVKRGGESCAFVGCYDHPNNGLLVDVAFDPYYNRVIDADLTADFMSYDNIRWVSGDSWVRMRERIGNLWQGFEWWK